jgi:antitoxin PrlF
MAMLSSLTRKGQVTIPKAVRDELGLEPFDRVEIELLEGEARLRRARSSLDEVAGTLPAVGVAVEDMPEIAKEEQARSSATGAE